MDLRFKRHAMSISAAAKYMRFEAVLFDLFGTLIPGFSTDRFRESLDSMSLVLGLDAEEFYDSWTFEAWHEQATGVLDTVEANLRAICSVKGFAVTDSQLNVATELRVTFASECLLPRPDTTSVLGQLQSHGLRLGLVSDCSGEVPAIWHETPFAKYFDAAVFSCVLGAKKPDPAMYRHVCKQIGIAPEKCLYIGDGFSRELYGAQRVGMHAVLIAVPGELSAYSSHSEASSWTGDRVSSLSEVN